METIRFYRKELPAVGDILMCKIDEVLDIGSYCSLLEYGGIRGMIGITEYSRLRIRSISKIVNVGKLVAAQVVAVDPVAKYIDLSKKVLKEEEVKECKDRYEKAKVVHTIVRKTAHSTTDADVTDICWQLYEELIWDLYTDEKTAYEVLRDISRQTIEVPASIREHAYGQALVDACTAYFQSKKQTISGLATIVCYGPDGIDATKRCLQLTKATFSGLRITYDSTSSFLFSVDDDDVEEGNRRVREAIEFAIVQIKKEVGGDGMIPKEEA
jgi:translation initiation factor 2 subunit 1